MTSAQKFLSLADYYLEILQELDDCHERIFAAASAGDADEAGRALERRASLCAAGREIMTKLAEIHRLRVEERECGAMSSRERERARLLLEALENRGRLKNGV